LIFVDAILRFSGMKILIEISSGDYDSLDVANHMLSGPYASLGKTRMVERNINHFLTGKWY